MNLRIIGRSALARRFRVHIAIIFACLATLGIAPQAAHAAADLDMALQFRAEIDSSSTLTIEIKPWSEDERALVMEMFQWLNSTAPGLIERAAQPGPIMLYRTASNSPDHPSAAWARRRHESSFIFRDDFFTGTGNNHQGVSYVRGLLVHETTHLADPVDRIAETGAWSDVAMPRLPAVSGRLSQEGISMRDAMYGYRDDLAMAEGLPSIYAAISRHEALAEYVALHLTKPDAAVPGDVAAFLDAHILSAPADEDGELARLYRSAHLDYRGQRYAQSAASLEAARALRPDFAMAPYLLGFVRLHSGEAEEAISVWNDARELIPADDFVLIREIRSGLDFAAGRTGN